MSTMRALLTALPPLLLLSACQGSYSVAKENEVFNSIRYDDIACSELRNRRNALADRNGVPRDAERVPFEEALAPGLGIFVPDMRGKQQSERARAIGEIDAMNRSLKRRSC